MGVERSVTRWYVQRQLIYNEINLLEVQLEQLSMTENAQEAVPVGQINPTDIEQQLKKAQEKLLLLGPCPRSMMG